MIELLRETGSYKVTRLFETKTFKITFVEDKKDHSLDRVRFVKLGDRFKEPEVVTIYRYEDEQLLEQMVSMYRE